MRGENIALRQVVSVGEGRPKRVLRKLRSESLIGRCFVFGDGRRKEKLKRRIEENCAGYSCRYYPQPCSIPRLQFVIIDREEIIFASSSYPTLCAIRQAELCEIFQAYFDAIWSEAVPLKEGGNIYLDEVDKVLAG